jgi:hypothetical protein
MKSVEKDTYIKKKETSLVVSTNDIDSDDDDVLGNDDLVKRRTKPQHPWLFIDEARNQGTSSKWWSTPAINIGMLGDIKPIFGNLFIPPILVFLQLFLNRIPFLPHFSFSTQNNTRPVVVCFPFFEMMGALLLVLLR